MADTKAPWKSALTPQKAPTYGNQAMLIACQRELQTDNVDYIVVFEGTKKYHVSNAEVVNPFTLYVTIPEHDTAEEVTVKVYLCQKNSLTILTSLKFTYISQMEHAIAKFLAHSASDPEFAEKLDAVWTVCSGKDHLELWDKRLAQAFSQLDLPIEWSLVGDILQRDCESQETLLHFAANHGLKQLINVFLELPGAKLALSTCNKSGLLPRDVARENGRLDLVEILDSDRFVEKRKTSAKDSSWRQVLRNEDNGVATITNARSHNILEDVMLLQDLSKLAKAKSGSPACRHSWPAKAQSHPDVVNYFEDLENELSKTTAACESRNNLKRSFLDENLIRLRDVTEELCQLRLQNSQKTSNEITIIADRNRTPMHSRRLSCPATVSRRRNVPPQGYSKSGQTRQDAQTPEMHTGNVEEREENASPDSEAVYSTPPRSPPIGLLIDFASTAAMTPPADESQENEDKTIEQCEFMTPMVSTPCSLPDPISPVPISYKYSTIERKSHVKKDRPNTWYGGPTETTDQEGEISRRSNSLEDFANKLAHDDTDDESMSETNSKEGMLETISSLVETVDRKGSFLSSLSDLSVGKESAGSETEAARVDSDEEKIGEESKTVEDRMEVDGREEHDSEEHLKPAEHLREREDIQERGNIEEPDEIPERGDNVERVEKYEGKVDHEEHEEVEINGEHEENHEDCEKDNELSKSSDLQEIKASGIKQEHEECGEPDEFEDTREHGEPEIHETNGKRSQQEDLSEMEDPRECTEAEPVLGESVPNGGTCNDVKNDNDINYAEESQVGIDKDKEGQSEDQMRTSSTDTASDTIDKESDSEVSRSSTPCEVSKPDTLELAVDNMKVHKAETDHPKHIRFNETVERLKSPDKKDNPGNISNELCDEPEPIPFRQRSALLLTVTKTPVKRTGSDISVTSLQDVQLDMHSTLKDDDISAGMLNTARRARSYGDISSFRDAPVQLTKGDESDEESLEKERRRFQEDQKQLSVQNRIKKFENVSRYASNEKLDEIATSRVNYERDDEDQGKRRWSNFFNAKNPKQPKKPGRTPTFRRDALRSSMSSITKVGKSSSKKTTIETLVTGSQAAALAKHSATAPNLQTAVTRPRAGTKDSPGTIRKSPTALSLDSEAASEYQEEIGQGEEGSEILDLDLDSDLENFDQEPEAWSVTVEKKMLKKMKKEEIKRQDVILELIQTEGHHLRTLKIMQQVFYRGLSKLVNYPTERLDQLFPRINQLVEITTRFHRNLRCRQDENAQVQKIGDVIVKQFSGENGQVMTEAYGEFVSKHPEAVALYKHYFKTDKKFSNFIKKCHSHRIVRRLSIPACFTLVTQRLTKYPPLIEALLKNTKPSNADHKELQNSLRLVKKALQAVDDAIKDYEKQSKLKDIKLRMEKGSIPLKNNQKIKNSRFVDHESKMICDGILQWKSARGKLTETHVVLLESMVVFLQENDKKFSLLSIDGKAPCIALKTLMVREVATDKNAMYFVSTSKKGPEMYEFVCNNPKEKRQWVTTIIDAISKAPEDIGDLFHSPEEEKKLAEERLTRRNEIIEIMKNKDHELSVLVNDKNKLFSEMKEILHASEGNGKPKEEEKALTSEKARTILLSAIQRTTQLSADSMQLLPESHSDSELAAVVSDEKASAPKRAETFGGFDRRPSQKGSRRQTTTTTITEETTEVNHVSQRRDSGYSTTSLASESVASALNTLSKDAQDGQGPVSFLQMLEALQWVLIQFTQKETALEDLRVQFESSMEENRKLRSMKKENDKNQLFLKEEHQAELTKQKKAYNDLERTFNQRVEDLNTKLKLQAEQHEELLKNFNELCQALRNK